MPQKRGFALLSKAQRQAIARMGGKRVQALGVGHAFSTDNVEEAQEAGRKGGLTTQAIGAGFKFNSERAKAAIRRRWARKKGKT